MTASEILDRHYLELRAKLLEIGATLDRIDRAGDGAATDPRLEQVREGLEILRGDTASGETASGKAASRAERIQQLFSRSYDPEWRRTFGL